MPGVVFETPTGSAGAFGNAGRRVARPHYIFESEMAFRRVAHYPLDWRGLATAELEILSYAT
jgi:hypothetical protein